MPITMQLQPTRSGKDFTLQQEETQSNENNAEVPGASETAVVTNGGTSIAQPQQPLSDIPQQQLTGETGEIPSDIASFADYSSNNVPPPAASSSNSRKDWGPPKRRSSSSSMSHHSASSSSITNPSTAATILASRRGIASPRQIQTGNGVKKASSSSPSNRNIPGAKSLSHRRMSSGKLSSSPKSSSSSHLASSPIHNTRDMKKYQKKYIHPEKTQQVKEWMEKKVQERLAQLEQNSSPRRRSRSPRAGKLTQKSHSFTVGSMNRPSFSPVSRPLRSASGTPSHSPRRSRSRPSSPTSNLSPSRYNTSPLRIQRTTSANRIRVTSVKANDTYRKRILSDIHLMEDPRVPLEKKKKAAERVRALEGMNLTEKGGEQRNDEVLLFNPSAFIKGTARKNKDVDSKFYHYEHEQKKEESPRARVEREKRDFANKLTSMSPRRLRESLDSVDSKDRYKHVKSRYKDDIMSPPSSPSAVKKLERLQKEKQRLLQHHRKVQSARRRNSTHGVSSPNSRRGKSPISPRLRRAKKKKTASTGDLHRIRPAPRNDSAPAILDRNIPLSPPMSPAAQAEYCDPQTLHTEFHPEPDITTTETSSPLVRRAPENDHHRDKRSPAASSPIYPSSNQSPSVDVRSETSSRSNVSSRRRDTFQSARRRNMTIQDESEMESSPPVKSPSPAKERPFSHSGSSTSLLSEDGNGHLEVKIRRFQRHK